MGCPVVRKQLTLVFCFIAAFLADADICRSFFFCRLLHRLHSLPFFFVSETCFQPSYQTWVIGFKYTVFIESEKTYRPYISYTDKQSGSSEKFHKITP